jgi:SPP1 gp7 family putative phage head morphogenesis protein
MNSPFHRPTRFELIYQREINRLLDQFFAFPTNATLGEINQRMVEFSQLRNFIFGNAQRLATNMVTMVARGNSQSWREAAAKASRGKLIYSMLRNEMKGALGVRLHSIIQQNADYISTLPSGIAERTTVYIQRETMKGRRSEDIMNDLRPYMQHLKNYEIQRIARTEVAKTDTAITRVRAESIGLNWYEWRTSEDARVRESHRIMNGVLVNWNDPPSPEALAHERSVGHYHAGEIYNCRCPALPVITLKSLSWPHKVYSNGSIRRLTMKQFALTAGIPLQLVA